jgi:hypothetical protein
MKKRIKKFGLTLAAIGALAFGGAAIANAVSSPSQTGGPVAKAAKRTSAKHRVHRRTHTHKSNTTPADRTEQESAGDKADTENGQETSDKGGQEQETSDRADQETSDKGDQEKGDQEKPDEGQDGKDDEQSGSEAPNDDGPGGHADEPGNSGADHESQGKE